MLHTPRRFAAALVILGVGCLPALGQTVQPDPPLGTDYADFEAYRTAGQLTGCTLGFRSFLREELSDNALVMLQGLLTFTVKDHRPAWSLKTVPSDVTRDAAGFLQPAPFTPSYAYPVFGSYSAARKEGFRYQCDGPGFCAAYIAADSFVPMLQAVEAGKFEVWYQRTPASLDVPSPTTLETGPASASFAFERCVRAMADQLR